VHQERSRSLASVVRRSLRFRVLLPIGLLLVVMVFGSVLRVADSDRA
jgi:hypothetical protein